MLWGLVALVVVSIAAWWLTSREQESEVVAELTRGSCEFDRSSDAGREHVPNATYRVDPPAGGDHASSPAPAGRYDESSAPDLANLVHSLEHGFVIVWHRPDAPRATVDVVEAVHDRFPRDVLVVPRASLDTPVAATAWHKRLLCDRAERDTLSRFVEEFRNKGPERVPH